MGRLAHIRAHSTSSDMIEGQPQHALIAGLLVVGAWSLLRPSEGTLLGLTATRWAVWSITLAFAHQILVAVVFRAQLHRNLMTRLFGKADMKVWAVLFMPLLAARPLTVLAVGLADTQPIAPYDLPLMLLGLALLAPALWALHSTLFYFTLPRALGGDHFREHFADMPLVERGAFRYTANAMYGVVFLGLWAIAFICNSWNAMVVALFQHAYIWVHMYCTEQPDMRWIYGKS